MKIRQELKQEIISDLQLYFPGKQRYEVENFERLSGADTLTFSFTLKLDKNKKFLILRIYRDITDRAEREFFTLKSLFSANLSVPQPFYWKKQSKAISKSYFIMEKIPGVILADYLFEEKSDNKKLKFIRMFIQELVNLHNVNWRDQFSYLEAPNVEANPYVFVENVIEFPKRMITQYNIVDLIPLIDWLEKNKEKSEDIVLIHGDYHMNNIIVTPEEKLVVIDWADIRLGDYRYDLGFAIVSTSSVGEDVTDVFSAFYQRFSGQNINQIEYFMILSVLHNILRCYSMILHPEITNENETTKYMLLVAYRTYTRYLVTLVKRLTGIQLQTLEKELSKSF